jgi:ubiquinone/menaquinone biosynthesis C-methylase UbiE
VSETTPHRSGFSDVDRSGSSSELIDYLDAARLAPSVISAKDWSFDRLDLQPGDSALDVGCGTGEDVVAMFQLVTPGGWSVGVDNSEVMVSQAVLRHGCVPNVCFEVADAQDLPFTSASFVAIRCERTLQHLSEPTRAVGEMVRVLRPGGRMVLLEPDWGTLVLEGADPSLTDQIVARHVARHHQPRMGRRLRGHMTAHGLLVEEVGAQAVVYTDFSSAMRAFGLSHAASLAVAAGIVNQSEGEEWVNDLWEADRSGGFLASVTGFRAFGRKPS